MSHTVTTVIDGKTITAEDFHRQARRWASMVRGAAKRNTLQFTKGKNRTSITKKNGKVERRLRDSIQYTIDTRSLRPSYCTSLFLEKPFK